MTHAQFIRNTQYSYHFCISLLCFSQLKSALHHFTSNLFTFLRESLVSSSKFLKCLWHVSSLTVWKTQTKKKPERPITLLILLTKYIYLYYTLFRTFDVQNTNTTTLKNYNIVKHKRTHIFDLFSSIEHFHSSYRHFLR